MTNRKGVCLRCHQPFSLGVSLCPHCGAAVDGLREVTTPAPAVTMPRQPFVLKRLCRTHGVYFEAPTIACPLCVAEKTQPKKRKEMLEARQETAEDKRKARNKRQPKENDAIVLAGQGRILKGRS